MFEESLEMSRRKFSCWAPNFFATFDHENPTEKLGTRGEARGEPAWFTVFTNSKSKTSRPTTGVWVGKFCENYKCEACQGLYRVCRRSAGIQLTETCGAWIGQAGT